jgi:hypothetical protein
MYLLYTDESGRKRRVTHLTGDKTCACPACTGATIDSIIAATQTASAAHQFATAPALQGAELTAGLRKLLEAKDCMVRAALPAR